MGGMGHIYYSSRAQYARDHNIPFEPFSTFLIAMDQEFLSHAAELAKADDPPPSPEE
jgi:hypothetical protein